MGNNKAIIVLGDMTWIIFGLLSALFAGAVAVLGKLGLQGLDSTLATTIRSVIMAGFLIVVSLISGKLHDLGAFTGRPLWYIIASGIAGALSWLFYFTALKFGPATAVAGLDRLSIVFVLILSALFLGETWSLKNVLAVIFIAIGAVLLVMK